MKSSYKSIRKGPVTHTGKHHVHFLQKQNGNGSPTHTVSVSLVLRQRQHKHSWWDIILQLRDWHRPGSLLSREHTNLTSLGCIVNLHNLDRGVWAMSIKIKYTDAFFSPLTKPASGTDATHTLHLHGATKPSFQSYSLHRLTAKTWPQFTWVDQIHYDQDL